MSRPKKYQICSNCGVAKLKASEFSRDSLVCKDCAALGAFATAGMRLYTCKFCSVDFPSMKSTDRKFCSNDCYKAYLNSDLHPRRNVNKVSPDAPDSEDSTSESKDSTFVTKSHTERCKDTLHGFESISKICSELHISYGYYQQLKSSGMLDEYIKSQQQS